MVIDSAQNVPQIGGGGAISEHGGEDVHGFLSHGHERGHGVQP